MPYTFKYGDRPIEGLTIQRAVGRGGFGEVYYALTDSGKQLAVKYLRENPEVELRGIAQVMNLKSPHLITIYDVKYNASNEPFVLMEYVSGPSLRDILTAEPTGLGVAKAGFFVTGICQGLSYLHERGIVHRDLKPANIFYDDGYVKIGDYGLSKHISVSRHSGQTVSVGTVHYMAPEIGSGSYTKAIDVYALGVILYEMLTGRLPFTGSSMGEILMRHLNDRPDLVGIPEPFAPVIAKALAKDPQQRYQDADELLAAVRECADLTQSVSSFDASTLTQVPRSPVDADRTVTTPRPPPVPTLDVREVPAARRSPEAAPVVPPPARSVEPGQGPFAEPGARAPETRADRRRRRRRNLGHVVVLGAVLTGVALALAWTHGQSRMPERMMAVMLFLLAGVAGPLLVHLRLLRNVLTRTALFDRLAYASVAGLMMIPAYQFAVDEAHSEELARVIFAPLAVLLLCNWGERIDVGRRGKVDAGAAFWPAVIGFVAASVFGANDYLITAAGICATMSLLAQAAAALWPGEDTAGSEPAGAGGPAPQRAYRNGPRPAGDAVAARDAQDVRGRGAAYAAVVPPPPPSVAAAGATSALAGCSATVCEPLVRRSKAVRVIFGILAGLTFGVALCALLILTIDRPHTRDGSMVLLGCTLGGAALLPFLLTKALCRYRLPLWRGTLRPLVISAALFAAAMAITGLSLGRLCRDERGAAIVTIVMSGLVGLTATAACGKRRRAYALPGTPAGAPESSNSAGESEGEIVAAAPSFAGQRPRPFIGFLGKALLVLGLVVALGQGPARYTLRATAPQFGWHSSSVLVESEWPRGIVILPLIFGSMLLIASRRHEGAGHLVRGVIGCVLVISGAMNAFLDGGGVLTNAIAMPFGGPGNVVERLHMLKPLVAPCFGPLAAGLVLLSWPRAAARRTIVL